jgi:hypothetical protein
MSEPRAMPITKFAAAYGIHPCTVWRALKAGRLQYVMVGKRKLVVPPQVQKASALEGVGKQNRAAKLERQLPAENWDTSDRPP